MENTEPLRLRARFQFLGRIIAWECSRCRKMFSITAEEALSGNGVDPPPALSAEFQQHDCTVWLFARFLEAHPDAEQQLAAAGPSGAGERSDK